MHCFPKREVHLTIRVVTCADSFENRNRYFTLKNNTYFLIKTISRFTTSSAIVNQTEISATDTRVLLCVINCELQNELDWYCFDGH